MRLFRRKREPEGEVIRGRALVCLYGSDSVETFHVAWSGEDEAIHYLVPSYFDKILFNLSAMPPEQERLLQKVEEFIEASRAKLTESMDVGLLRESGLAGGYFAAVGLAPLTATAPVERPFAEIDVEVTLIAEKGVAGAATEFRPLQATNERAAELGLWLLWDWSIAAGNGNPDAVTFLLNVLNHQCLNYRENGMPQVWQIGQAPFAALTQQLRAQGAFD